MADSIVTRVGSDRKIAPVVAWAWIGGLFLALEAYVIGAWMTSDYFRPIKDGVDQISPQIMDGIHMQEHSETVIAFLVVLWMVYQCWRAKRLTAPALFVIAWGLCFWQDPISSYFRPFLFYSAGMFNYGTWGTFIPGFSLPNGQLAPQPLISLIMGYVGMTPLWGLACAWVLRKLKNAFPALGPVALLLIGAVLIGSVDFALESSSVKQGLYGFPTVFAPLSIYVGETYQYPVYSSYCFGASIAVMSVLLTYRNAQGLTPVEVGSEAIASSFKGSLMRLLAITGATNVGLLLLYMVPMALFSLGGDSVPRLPLHLFNPAICTPDARFVCQGITAPAQQEAAPEGEGAPQ
jgi:hypothetical protein